MQKKDKAPIDGNLVLSYENQKYVFLFSYFTGWSSWNFLTLSSKTGIIA